MYYFSFGVLLSRKRSCKALVDFSPLDLLLDLGTAVINQMAGVEVMGAYVITNSSPFFTLHSYPHPILKVCLVDLKAIHPDITTRSTDDSPI